MATVILEIFLGKLGEKALERVGEQASLLFHFRENFQWLQRELRKFRGYLQHSDNLSTEVVKNWLAEVQDIAFDAEDIFEACAVHSDSLHLRCKMGRKIRKLKDRIESIMKDPVAASLVQQMCDVSQPIPFHGREEWKKAGLLERDARPVGIDPKVEQILPLLEDDKLQIIAVLGMGGIGKTFLLQHVYNHPKVRERFEKAIWLSISQVYNVAQLQYDIASHFNKDVKEGGVREQLVAEMIKKVRVRKQRVAELVKEGGLSEQQASELIKKVGVRKQRVQLIKERGLDEQQATALINECGLCEQQAAQLIQVVGERKQRDAEWIKTGGLSEQKAIDLIEMLEVESFLIERSKQDGVSEEQARNLIDMLRNESSLPSERIKESGVKEWVKELIMERGRNKEQAVKLIEEWIKGNGLSEQQAPELIQMLRYEGSLIEWIKKGGLTDQQAAAQLIKEGGSSEQQATELIQMLTNESSLLEWTKEAGVTGQQAQKLIEKGIISKELAANLIQKLKEENSQIKLIKPKNGVSEQRAAELIQKRLKYQSSLMVLDDVWRGEGDNVKNLIEKLGIPGGISFPRGISNPCKVVVTTRSKDVGASHIYHMDFLSEQDSWNLFCLHAFPDDQQNRPSKELHEVFHDVETECGKCDSLPHAFPNYQPNRPPKELHEVAHNIERECGKGGSLPLAIKTIAASMANKKRLTNWESMLTNWESRLTQLKEVSRLHDPIGPVLRLSYDALSATLKRCFLYFSFFGEDVEIDAEYLIYLWIAEGFISEGNEDWKTGWRYLKQLNDLCLVEVTEDWELKKTCKIHDLLLDLSVSISKENKCAFTIEEASDVGCRRLLLTKKVLNEVGISRLKCPKSLRTLSLSQNSVTELPTKSFTSVKALRVIDLSYTRIFLLPRCFNNFKLLRVLNLSNTSFKEVPDCVRNLNRLCFLNVDTCLVPEWIGELECLQHLHVFRVDYSPEISAGISKLVSLRTLRSQDEIMLVLKNVATLSHLEELRIHIANAEEDRSMEEEFVPCWVRMRHLTIIYEFEYSKKILFPEKMKVMEDLEYLSLWRFVVPRWICVYGNLRVIKFRDCEWSECPAFETMPKLLKLELIKLRCKELPESFGKSGAFPQLRSLIIKECFNLEKLPDLQHGSMPRVELFEVYSCGRLQKIPEGFEHLGSLKLLHLKGTDFTNEERKRIKEGGEYWNKIKANNSDFTISITLPSLNIQSVSIAAFIDIVIGKLGEAVVGKLGEIAVEEIGNQASLLLNFKKDFQWLQSKLTYVRGYLQYPEGLPMKTELVKKWLADLQDIAFDAEDILQECVIQSLPSSSTQIARNGNSLTFRYKTGRRIRNIKDRMKFIIEDANEFKLVHQVLHDGRAAEDWNKSAVEEWKKSCLLERDARPVAINAKVEQILHFLEDDSVQVIAVVGMGGIGKTFLLQNVYNHPKVRERFQKAIWLSISQVYSVARLQDDIAFPLDLDLKKGGDRVSEQLAAELIHERLRDKSCLIVLDDVWRVEGVDNLMQRLGIRGGISNPCIVVVTTRSVEVCNIMGASRIYHMELLSQQDSRNLFCLHAFQNEQQNRPPKELIEVAHQVERECARLPLAIKTVAASMAGPKDLSCWRSKLLQLKEVSHLEDPIGAILRLSYDALPAVLKPCFLYFCFFGEDVEIDAEYLIYLWIGEGFIPEGNEQWNTGWSYLKQLNYLCLVEVTEDWELKKTCKIHDLLLDLSICISKENICAFTVEEASYVRCRRVLCAKKGLDNAGISKLKCLKSLRTLSLSQNSVSKLPTESLRDVRALRVMDLSYTIISLLPRCIRNFKVLRVLNLSNTPFREVPDCVRNLNRLCFLNVDTCLMPKWIGDLKCLQHLHVFRVDYSQEISAGISELVSLRTLRSQNEIMLVLKDVAKLMHLEELRLHIANAEEDGSMAEEFLPSWTRMRHLTIIYEFEYSRKILFPEKMKEMKDLEYLFLWRFAVPTWICQYRDLRVIKLRGCVWGQCPAFQTMPNLLKLELIELECEELPESFGNSGAFPQLRSLVIKQCFRLEKLPDLQYGSMPRVETFEVYSCERMQKIPEGFENLRSLKLLNLTGTNFTVDERERLKGGEYWNKIKTHNPHVTIRMLPSI